MKPKIITSFIYPPIPIRSYDWTAYRDGTEPEGKVGYGATEDEAVEDLIRQEEED